MRNDRNIHRMAARRSPAIVTAFVGAITLAAAGICLAEHTPMGLKVIPRPEQVVLRCVSPLTPREREVAALVPAGKANEESATELGTGERTIKVHCARMMTKMPAASLAELGMLAQSARPRRPIVLPA